jgi:hypothetical protein
MSAPPSCRRFRAALARKSYTKFHVDAMEWSARHSVLERQSALGSPMNWPGPIEFTYILFLALFFSWIKATLCVATAIVIRARLLSIAIAAVIGVAEDALGHPRDIFFAQFLDFYNDVFLGLTGLAGVLWGCIGRAVRTLAIWGYRLSSS